MIDLVKRLRELSAPPYDSACFGGPMRQAADLIERLESQIKDYRDACDQKQNIINCDASLATLATAKIDELRQERDSARGEAKELRKALTESQQVEAAIAAEGAAKS